MGTSTVQRFGRYTEYGGVQSFRGIRAGTKVTRFYSVFSGQRFLRYEGYKVVQRLLRTSVVVTCRTLSAAIQLYSISAIDQVKGRESSYLSVLDLS